MTPLDLIRIVVLVEAALLALALVLWASIAARRAHRRAFALAAESEARALLSAAIVNDEAGGGSVARLGELPRAVLLRVLTEVARSLTGAQKERIAEIAAIVGLSDRALDSAVSSTWWHRLHAARFFSVVGGGDAVASQLLADPHPLVRAEAVEWAAAEPKQERTQALLSLLSSTDEPYHFAVMDAIVRIGSAAIPGLVRWLETPIGDAAVPGLRVAAHLPDTRFLGAALRLGSDTSPRAREAATVLLGGLGGDDAIAALLRATSDDSVAVRAVAVRGLGRLRHCPAAAALRDRLRDPSWAVRREAALALRALGAPGELVLRHMVGDADRYAADMARHLLDWPARPITGAIPR